MSSGRRVPSGRMASGAGMAPGMPGSGAGISAGRGGGGGPSSSCSPSTVPTASLPSVAVLARRSSDTVADSGSSGDGAGAGDAAIGTALTGPLTMGRASRTSITGRVRAPAAWLDPLTPPATSRILLVNEPDSDTSLF